jgi:ribosomal protein S18 acetylase RimI-like enzyme
MVTNQELNALFAAAWPEPHTDRDFAPVLARSMGYICAYVESRLIGFVNVAWDGGSHAFLLDPTVHPDVSRQGIGSELVRRATELARSNGAEWLHVDYEPHLAEFYRKCGFRKTEAGLIRLGE